MTWNFLAKTLRAAAMALAGAAGACAPAPALDTPAPALPGAAPAIPVRVVIDPERERMAIRSARARTISVEDKLVKQRVHPSRRDQLNEPILVTVETATPFDATPRSAAPVVVINGQPIYGSFFDFRSPNRISAIVPNGRGIEVLEVRVGMLGNLERTISNAVAVQIER